MSLVCGEHSWTGAGQDHRDFLTTDVIYAVQRPGHDSFTAVCQAAIDAIPAQVRHRQEQAGGFNVHRGHSTPNALPGLTQNASLNGFQLGDRLFSLTAEQAECYLPHSWRRAHAA
jgi:hypothetical protein